MHSVVHRSFSLYILLAGLMGLGLCHVADAQQQSEVNDEIQIDPISFKGPDPEERFSDIRIEQNLGAQVPLELEFKDEQGSTVTLADYFDADNAKPVVLALVYYSCPSMCNLIMNAMVAGMDSQKMGLEIGEDYEVVTVSIDPNEKPELAAAKKKNYLEQFRRDGAEEGWHFLTGEENEIEDLAQAVGYRYYYDEKTNQYVHASGIMVLTPEGKVSSYYLGMEYLPQNLELALMDASDERIGSLARQLVLLCYAYDPAKGTYSFYIMSAVRVFAFAVLGAIGLFWLSSYLRKPEEESVKSEPKEH